MRSHATLQMKIIEKKVNIIALFLVSLILLLSFTGCSSNGEELVFDLQNTLNALISGDITENAYVYSAEFQVNDPDSNHVLQKLTSKIIYKIVRTKISENSGTANIKFTCPDAYTMLQEVALKSEVNNVDLLLHYIEMELDGAFPTIEFDIVVDLKFIGNHWYLIPNSDLSNALSCGLVEKYTELGQKVIERLAEEDK